MNGDPLFDRLHALPVPRADASAKAKALHRSLTALGTGAVSSSTRRAFFSSKVWIPALLACLVVLAWIGITEKRHADETIVLREVLRQMEATFQGQLAAVVLQDGEAKVLVSKEASAPGDQPLLITIHAAGGSPATRILTFSGRWIDLPLNGTTVHVQALDTGSGRVVLAGDRFLWDGSSRIAGVRIEGRFL